MFTFLKKQPRVKSTNKLIEEIHETFNIAGDKILESAKGIINKCGENQIEKI